jgi:DNA-binding LytR/AlgR family response regulator
VEAVAATVTEAESILARTPTDLVVVDVPGCGDPDSAATLEQIRALCATPAGPHFVLATDDDRLTEPEALGALERVLSPVTAERLEQCLRRLSVVLSRPVRVVARRQRSLVFLNEDEVLACEADGRLTYVHSPFGRFDLDLNLTVLRVRLGRVLVRVHRNWLVNMNHVLECASGAGGTTLLVGVRRDRVLRVPVANSHSRAVRAVLLRNAVGLRRGERRREDDEVQHPDAGQRVRCGAPTDDHRADRDPRCDGGRCDPDASDLTRPRIQPDLDERGQQPWARQDVDGRIRPDPG